MKEHRYVSLYNTLKTRILLGDYKEGDLLASENELAMKNRLTRVTVRHALDELVKDGLIEKRQGLGSVVKAKQKNLGLPFMSAFTRLEGSLDPVKTIFVKPPQLTEWDDYFFFPLSNEEKAVKCIYFKLLRVVGDEPLMLEYTYLPNFNLQGLVSKSFIRQSLFETLLSRYQLEVISAEQETRAIAADKSAAKLLQLKKGKPLVQLTLKFHTSQPNLRIYSRYLYNTDKYPLVNK